MCSCVILVSPWAVVRPWRDSGVQVWDLNVILVQVSDRLRMVLISLDIIFEQRKGNGNALFNDAFNTFYIRLYGVEHMVKDLSDSERGNPLRPHGLLLKLTAMAILYAPSHRQDCLCYTSPGALAGTRNSSMGPPHEGSIQRPIAPLF